MINIVRRFEFTVGLEAMMMKIVLVLSLVVLGLVTIASYERILEERDRQFVQAAWNGQLLKMKVLRLLGTNINVYPGGRQPAIVSAAWAGQNHCIKYLLDRGATINAKDKFGWTALIAAAHSGKVETVELLLSRGANINAVSMDGSALRLALEKNNQEVIALLKQHGAKDCDGRQFNNCN
jgi:hypothetical protein